MVAKDTIRAGVIGYPVAHSLSPAMHNAAFDSLGMNWRYVPIRVRPERLRDIVLGLESKAFRGINVTIPHKENVIPLLDKVSPEVTRIGAVNTVTLKDGKLSGENTDWSGFLAALEELNFDPAGCNALILGSGGAARAIAYALASCSARILMSSRNRAAGDDVAKQVRRAFPRASITWAHNQALRGMSIRCDLLVNATPVGMSPRGEFSPWPDEVPLPQCSFVYDTVYNPSRTRLMEQASSRGMKCANGLSMLVHQAALSFSIWTGRSAPIDVMRKAISYGDENVAVSHCG
ncbi:MAG: shikimate dehydrogenase [Desulfomonile tiedjei]|nr:shikimate dehydrogenase [Desulfomonile tiedjei]